MKISSIQNLNKINTNASFKASVTQIYSDFDGTITKHEVMNAFMDDYDHKLDPNIIGGIKLL